MVQEGKVTEAFNELLVDFGKGEFPEGLKYEPGNPGFDAAWQVVVKAALEANDPGRFTAFIGYEFPINEPSTGKEIDLINAQGRQRWEPLYEVTRTKGDSETHPLLSPNDEFADYETWDFDNIGLTAVKQPEML